jgi:transcriptional regulator with XRE-family HTH domain
VPESERKALADELRRAIAESGLTLYRLSKESGVDPSQLSRFTRSKRDLGLMIAEKLCEVLGLELVKTRAGRSPKRDGSTAPPRRPAHKKK